MLMTIQYYRTAIQNQNQNQNQNQSEIIRNSSTVPVPEFQYCPEFPENSRAAREFSSGWRKSSSQEFRIPPQRLTQIPARARARDTRATDSVLGSCVILRNSAVAGNRPESPAGIYINPGGLEGVRVRINRFTAPAKGVRVWQFTVAPPARGGKPG